MAVMLSSSLFGWLEKFVKKFKVEPGNSSPDNCCGAFELYGFLGRHLVLAT